MCVGVYNRVKRDHGEKCQQLLRGRGRMREEEQQIQARRNNVGWVREKASKAEKKEGGGLREGEGERDRKYGVAKRQGKGTGTHTHAP